MGFVVCDRASGEVRQWSNVERPAEVPASQVLIESDRAPDARAERWNGKKGLRKATNKELSDAAAALDARRTARVGTDPFQATILDVLWDLEQRLRAAGQASALTWLSGVASAKDLRAAIGREAVARPPEGTGAP